MKIAVAVSVAAGAFCSARSELRVSIGPLPASRSLRHSASSFAGFTKTVRMKRSEPHAALVTI